MAQTLSKKNKDKNLHILADVKKEIKKTKEFNKFLEKNKLSSVLLISDKHDEVINENIRFKIEMPFIDELLNPFLLTIPLQLLAYHVALLKKCDIDKPRNLAKSVTVE